MHTKIFILTMLISCSKLPSNNERTENRERALNKRLELSAPVLQSSIEKFKDFYSDFSVKQIESKLKGLYAQNSYFKDGVKSVEGIDQLDLYFKHSVKNIYSCKFEIEDVIIKENSTYFRWKMNLQKKKNDAVSIHFGMSYVLFDVDGKILFHQDYLDFSELLEDVTLIGSLIKYIKNY